MDEEKKWLCGHCDFGWDLLGEFCCNKHGNEGCPYPCTECSDFKETDMDEQKKKQNYCLHCGAGMDDVGK